MAKILAVDDEPLICQVITDCLQDCDEIDVVCASDGKMGASRDGETDCQHRHDQQ